MEIAGYILSLFIGATLGLIGGGGSILTVPVLVYSFSINPVLSTSYSLFIVGSTSLIGAIVNYRKNLVSVKIALLFGLTSVTTVFIIRKCIIPHVPENLFTIGKYTVTHSLLTMLLFAGLMIMAAKAMIKKDTNNIHEAQKKVGKTNLIKLLFYGIAVGSVTGILGAGGGFLLIPTLVLFVRLPMKEAVGTSLLIIALNSLVGFAGDIGRFTVDWLFLIKITLIAIAGIFTGSMISKKIDGDKLKNSFGWFILVMGMYIFIKEIIR